MEFESILKVASAFALVVAGIILAIVILKRIHPSYLGMKASQEVSKLKIEEQLYITPSKRVVVISYENQKYVLLLGDTELVIDKITKGSDI